MNYETKEWTVKELYKKHEDENLDLNPPYQRNEIWSSRLKRELIDSIKKGYPLPAFFIYKKDKNTFEMVDGQQRSKAIFGYVKRLFADNQKSLFEDDNNSFWDYKLSIVQISNVDNEGIIEDIYTRINKLGMKLNRPELKKAEYFDTNFLELSQELASMEEFQKLGLFTPHSVNRMNDLDFITELLAFLKFGITDKKKKADQLFEHDISQKECKVLKEQFTQVVDRLLFFNEQFPLKSTRYRQKNDFYTLFNFLFNNKELGDDFWNIFYNDLLHFEPDISPSNEECIPFQEYAYHCVTQSNSAKARNARLDIINEVFLNEHDQSNKVQNSILTYYGEEDSSTLKIENYLLIDVRKFN